MKRSILASAIILSLGAICYAIVPQTHIFRNDGRFDILHGPVTATHPDSLPGVVMMADTDDTIPVPMAAIDSICIENIAIPQIHIVTPDNPELTQIVEKETYVSALISMEGNGYVEDLPETTVSIKGRGNTTWRMPKKPMRLKFKKKTQIPGLKKAKNYVLLANYIDPSLMRNAVAMWIAREMGIPTANNMMPCDVQFNGNNIGSFMLTEKVGINAASVDIEETEGVLLELSFDYDEKYKFMSKHYDMPVMVKDPDFDELEEEEPDWGTAEEHFNLWRDEYENAEKFVAQDKAFEAFDLDSFVDYILVVNITRNHDIGGPKSVFIHKARPGEDCKWIAGPLWDFDAAFNLCAGAGYGASGIPYNAKIDFPILFEKMMLSKEFQERYAERFDYFYTNVYPRLLEFVDTYGRLIRASAKSDGLLWPYDDKNVDWCYALDSFDHEKHTAILSEWLTNRVEWLKRRVDRHLIP